MSEKTVAIRGGRGSSSSSNDDQRQQQDIQDAAAYNRYCSAAVDLSNAHVSKDGLLTVIRSVRDIDHNKRRRFLYTIPIPSLSRSPSASASLPQSSAMTIPPVEIHDSITLRLPSPSGEKIAVFRNEQQQQPSSSSSSVSETKHHHQVLEIWTNHGQALHRRILLKDTLHGKVVSDPHTFRGPSWSFDESMVAYAAERLPVNTVSFFHHGDDDGNNHVDNDDDEKKNVPIRGGQYALGQGRTERWGEQYHQLSALFDLFCVNADTGNIQRIANVPGGGVGKDKSTSRSGGGGYTLCQPVFSPDGQCVVYTAFDAGGDDNMPRRLGLIYCQQRPCKLYSSSIVNLRKRLLEQQQQEDKEKVPDDDDDPYVVLTPNHRLSSSPRFSPPLVEKNGDGDGDDGDGGSCSRSRSKLVFLSSQRGFDTHSGCVALHAMDWVDGKPVLDSHDVVIDEVTYPADSPARAGELTGLRFPGLFAFHLPDQCFLSTETVALNTQWGSCQKIVCVSIKHKTLRLVKCSGDDGGGVESESKSKSKSERDDTTTSDNVLCVEAAGGAMIVTRQSPVQPATLHRVSLADPDTSETTAVVSKTTTALLPPMYPICASSSSTFSSSPITQGPPFMDYTYRVINIDDTPSVDGVESDVPRVQCILYLPNNKTKQPKKPPLIVSPHGGPHSAYSTAYAHNLAYLCGHGGYAVLLVNYRGSVGYSKSSVECLPGRIGDTDVRDVVAATEQVKASGLVDANRVGISGGSHGGFLTAHCTGQYPNMFKAAAMRNPVVNLASMVTSTDIPDWVYVEAFGSYRWDAYRPPKLNELEAFWEKSPIRYIDSVVTPTLIVLGLRDLRVPPSQGLEWYHSLRSKKRGIVDGDGGDVVVPTKLLEYEADDHPIAGVAAEADSSINIKLWFDKYL